MPDLTLPARHRPFDCRFPNVKRHGESKNSAGFQHPVDFRKTLCVVRHVLEYFGGRAYIKTLVCICQSLNILALNIVFIISRDNAIKIFRTNE